MTHRHRNEDRRAEPGLHWAFPNPCGVVGAVLALVLAWSPHAAVGAPAATVTEGRGAVPPAPSLGFDLQEAEQTLGQLQNQLRTAPDDRSLAAIAARAATLESQSAAAAGAWGRDLPGLNKTLRHPPSRSRTPVAAAERARFAARTAERAALLARVAKARGISAGAAQTFTQVAERRREGFSARVLEQSASPLSPSFWSALQSSLQPDFARLDDLARDAATVAMEAEEPRGGIALGLGIMVALILLWPVRWGLKRLARSALIGPTHHGRFGRTAYAVWMSVVDVATPVLAVASARLAASWGGLLSDGAAALADALVVAVGWAAAVMALGHAIATGRDPDGCVTPLPKPAAARARQVLRLAAVVTAGGYLLSRLNYVVGASVAATIASNALVALAYAAVAGLALLAFSQSASPADGDDNRAGAPAWTLVSLALGAAIVVTLGATLLGFTTLAVLISGQMFWVAVLAAATFLLLRLAEDLCTWLFDPKGRGSRLLGGVFRVRAPVVAQVGILAAAALQVTLLLGALSLALTPFGESGRLLFAHVGGFGGAIHLGSATVSPRAILSGLAAFAFGLLVVHLLRGWLLRRYLPVTGWDAGVRNSVSTGVGYLGVAIAALCAMAAMGLGLRQIALVASALSVGIGFGLQQVVQNFVSGVILLIERPVKVGDWVDVGGGVEGDIRRIRVRATEIQTFDRTTVIVPNSDLITKQVANKTRGDRGRVKLELSIANPVEAARARDLILMIAEQSGDVLPDPKPAVYIDGLASAGAVNFKCYLFVRSPRDVTRVRSELYFAVLDAFQGEGIAFTGAAGSQNVVVEPGPALAAALQLMSARPPPGDRPDAERLPSSAEARP